MLRVVLCKRRIAALLGVLTLATACSTTRIGGSAASTLPHINVTHPVVIVPGILGSRLEDERNGRVVWGKIFSLRALTVHESLIQPDYDGRDGLELPIESRDLRTNRDHLVAHSMGGLIVEYYLLYGDEDVLDREPLPAPTYAGAANVRRVVLLGVPHLGSVEALQILDEGYHVGWRTISNEATFTMPSVYQLLPPSGAVHLREPVDGQPGVDLYDPPTWERYELSVFSPKARRAFLRRCKVLFPNDWRRQTNELYTNFPSFLETVLRRAARLHEALAAFPDRPPGPQVFLIGSATRPTLAQAELNNEGRDWRLLLGSSAADPAGGKAPGDGTVTAASFTWGAVTSLEDAVGGSGTAGAGFPVTWVDERHARLPRNLDVLRRIAEILSH